MPTIYISEKNKKQLRKIIDSSRTSPIIGSPKRFNSFNDVITFFLKVSGKVDFEILDHFANQPQIQFDMAVEDYDNPKRRKQLLEKKFKEAEEEGKE